MRFRSAFSLAMIAATAVLLTAAAGRTAAAAEDTTARATVPVETFTLDNGMTILLVRQPEKSTVTAGWVAHVGSSNEKPGMTGISHLFEHMMFKGSHVIGTKDIKRDLEIIADQEKLQETIRLAYEQQRARYRRGEIDDPFDPKSRPAELVELEKSFQALVDEQRSLMVKDEFDKVYTEAGGSQMNAFTNQDMTVYFITVPANKLELWFWMESDRLGTPVFREFYSERDVVHEERRLRTESTPTGKFDEMFEAMFWESHPYTWPVVGWPSDLQAISKAQADDYFSTYYAPNNVTAAIVGNFDTAQVKELARRYFGRIPRGSKQPPTVPTLEMTQMAEKRMNAECDCQPQATVWYHTVPFRHKDSYALDVLGGLMNGQTGRLQKSLVLDRKIATNASASQNSMKWAGAFAFTAESKGGATPGELESAWYDEAKKIVDEPIPAEELQKVKNQIAADAFRRLDSPFFLMIQLLVYDGEGDWTYLQDWAEKTSAVTEADVKRVAKTYLTKENRTVGLYDRKAGTAAEEAPPELSGLPAEAMPMIQSQLKALKEKVAGMNDPAELEKMLAKMHESESAAPEPFRKVMPLFTKVVEDRLKAVRESGGQPAPAPAAPVSPSAPSGTHGGGAQ